jgi:hypothetical protein
MCIRDRYKAAAVTPTAGELPLAPPEATNLSLWCSHFCSLYPFVFYSLFVDSMNSETVA